MSIAAIILGFIVGGFGVFVIASQCGALVVNARNARRGIERRISFVPFVGPMLATGGMLLVEDVTGDLGWFILAAWALDPGTWMGAYGLGLLLVPGSIWHR